MASGAKIESSSQIQLMDAASPTKLRAYQGVLHVAYAEHEIAGSDIGVQVKMVRMPKGARVVDGYVWHDALGANTFITVGDSDDTDRFMTVYPTNRATVDGITGRSTQWGPNQAGDASTGIFVHFGTGRFNRVSGSTDKTTGAAETGVGYLYTCEKDILISFSDVAATGTISLKVEYIVS